MSKIIDFKKEKVKKSQHMKGYVGQRYQVDYCHYTSNTFYCAGWSDDKGGGGVYAKCITNPKIDHKKVIVVDLHEQPRKLSNGYMFYKLDGVNYQIADYGTLNIIAYGYNILNSVIVYEVPSEIVKISELVKKVNANKIVVFERQDFFSRAEGIG